MAKLDQGSIERVQNACSSWVCPNTTPKIRKIAEVNFRNGTEQILVATDVVLDSEEMHCIESNRSTGAKT